jgi:hypothetical protein
MSSVALHASAAACCAISPPTSRSSATSSVCLGGKGREAAAAAAAAGHITPHTMRCIAVEMTSNSLQTYCCTTQHTAVHCVAHGMTNKDGPWSKQCLQSPLITSCQAGMDDAALHPVPLTLDPTPKPYSTPSGLRFCAISSSCCSTCRRVMASALRVSSACSCWRALLPASAWLWAAVCVEGGGGGQRGGRGG